MLIEFEEFKPDISKNSSFKSTGKDFDFNNKFNNYGNS